MSLSAGGSSVSGERSSKKRAHARRMQSQISAAGIKSCGPSLVLVDAVVLVVLVDGSLYQVGKVEWALLHVVRVNHAAHLALTAVMNRKPV